MSGARQTVAKVLCQSGKFETGQGTCAVICMLFLGNPRKYGCGECERVHGALADQILTALENSREA